VASADPARARMMAKAAHLNSRIPLRPAARAVASAIVRLAIAITLSLAACNGSEGTGDGEAGGDDAASLECRVPATSAPCQQLRAMAGAAFCDDVVDETSCWTTVAQIIDAPPHALEIALMLNARCGAPLPEDEQLCIDAEGACAAIEVEAGCAMEIYDDVDDCAGRIDLECFESHGACVGSETICNEPPECVATDEAVARATCERLVDL
jgi:hypothetical protein